MSKFSDFVNRNWKRYWQTVAVLVFAGIMLLVFGVNWGLALVFFPLFFLVVGYYFKSKQ